MFQYNCILSLCTEHIDILTLLNLICYIIDSCLLLFCIFLGIVWCRIFIEFFQLSTICFYAVFQCQIFSVDILKENCIFHLVTELLIFQTTKFYKWTDAVPVFLIIFTFCLAHTCKLVCNFLGNVLSNLAYKSIILKSAT